MVPLLLLAAAAFAADAPARLGSLEQVLLLEQKPDPAKVPYLMDVMSRDESASARAEAARALGLAEYRKPYGLEALARAMLKDPSAEVRRRAALAALEHEGHEAVAAVEAFLKAEGGEHLRREIALALAAAHVDDSEATAAVASLAAEDPSAETRAACVQALAKRGDRRATAALKRVADKDADKGVRKEAKKAVESLSRTSKP